MHCYDVSFVLLTKDPSFSLARISNIEDRMQIAFE